jgi:hypothetical protein
MLKATMRYKDFEGRPMFEQKDCAVRAFTVASGKPYAEVAALFIKHGRQVGKGSSYYTMRKVAAEIGLIETTLKYKKERLTAARFVQSEMAKGKVAACKRGHAFAVVNGEIADAEGVPPRSLVYQWWTPKVIEKATEVPTVMAPLVKSYPCNPSGQYVLQF